MLWLLPLVLNAQGLQPHTGDLERLVGSPWPLRRGSICSHVEETELLTILFSAFNLISSLLVVLLSYMLILLTIFQMRSAEGRKKAFSTCGSHLTVVVVFYGSLLFMYVQPKSAHSFEYDKAASVFYTLVIDPCIRCLVCKPEAQHSDPRTHIKYNSVASAYKPSTPMSQYRR